MSTAHSESLRKVVHIAMSGFALLLRWIPWWLGALLAAAALILNVTWIPRALGGRLIRAGERERILRSGVVLYALAILLLILIFRNHLEVAACAWGVLAFGDGASTLLGRGIGGPRLPWNPRKSWVGSAAFLVSGTLGGAGLMIWVAQRPAAPSLSIPTALLLAGSAAFLGAVVESLPLELDDNLTVPLLAGGLVYSLQQVDPLLWSDSASALSRNFWTGVGVNLAFALAARALRAVSWSGVVGGLLVGIVIATFAGLEGFALLGIFFVLGSAATRLGYARKTLRGAAQEEGGVRGMVHAVANCSVAAYLAFLAASTPVSVREALSVAFVASLATAACDTLGSEVGPLGRGEPFLITRLRRVPVGTPGAVSALGTAAGAAGALILALTASFSGLIPASAIPIVIVAALFGALLESVLGATLEPKGLIGSETVNFLNTLVGALTALVLVHFRGIP